MKWILAIVFSFALAAESSAQVSVCLRCPPPAPIASVGIYAAPVCPPPPVMIQAVPVQPVIAVPATIQVQTMIPQARPRRCCGFLRRLFHRRRIAYTRGPTLQYTLQTKPPPGGEQQPSQ